MFHGFGKVIQKRLYDTLSQKYSLILFILACAAVIVSALQFGEAWLQWSSEKYEAVFNSFSDNIRGKSFQANLCQYVPVDVVYTWVNGSDPMLLQQLRKFQERLLDEQIEPQKECYYRNCVPSHIVVAKEWVEPEVVEGLAYVDRVSYGEGKDRKNRTLHVFEDVAAAKKAVELHPFAKSEGRNVTLHTAYWTSDQEAANSHAYENAAFISGIRDGLDQFSLREKIEKAFHVSVMQVWIYNDKRFAVVVFASEEYYAGFIKHAGNITIDGKEVHIGQAQLIHYLPSLRNYDDFSPNRYEDKEELRYSLRSLEKHAPWVRHIYLVTNGQIPHWINLDNPQIKIITHEEIFPNKSDLPTFSSPAIESHLHRIPGLSDKFLYLNDDVMFGTDIWPEDFYTHSRGQKVYLSWPLPECQDGCPSSWIADGYCDKSCNNADCMWDGGDCDKKQQTFQGNFEDDMDFWHGDLNHDSCAVNCINGWLADKYCDTNCNVRSCGFDAGDCGVDHFHLLTEFQLHNNVKNYFLPKGETVAFFNISSFINNDTHVSGSYGNNPAIRSIALSLKFKLIILILNPNFNSTLLDFQLVVNENNIESVLNFTLRANTVQEVVEIKPFTESNTSIDAMSYRFKGFDSEHLEPQLLVGSRTPEDTNRFSRVNVSATNFTDNIKLQLAQLEKDFRNGYISSRGFFHRKAAIIADYVSDAALQHTTLNLVYEKVPMVVHTRDEEPVFRGNVQRKLLWHRESSFRSRRLQAAYGDSLVYVNRLYNKAFGFEARKVPAHMPHFIDKHIFSDMQKRFAREWKITSSHKIRSSDDMQFAFSYFYYLMSESVAVNASEVFDKFDTDHSGTWSDREIRTFLTQLYELPLVYSLVQKFEDDVINCSQHLPEEFSTGITTPLYERYYDSKLPIVSKNLIVHCEKTSHLIHRKFHKKSKYTFEIVGEEDVTFVMLRSNLSKVITQLDEIRRKPKKFICLNDNLEEGNKKDNEVIRALLQDFYESLFPIQSAFELPPDYRNRFLHVSELNAWLFYRDAIKLATYLCLILLVVFLLSSMYNMQVRRCKRFFVRLWRNRFGHGERRNAFVTADV